MSSARRKPNRRHRSRRRPLGFWDRLWLRRGRSIRISERARRALVAFVRLGDGWLWILVALLLWVFLPSVLFRRAAATGLLAACISLPVYWGVKAAFRRARPYTLFTWISPAISPRDRYSFPSGHTMNNLAVAAALALHVPWLWPLAVGVPVTMGLLRVLFGVHFVSDILGGLVLGLACAFAAYGLQAVFAG